MTEFELAQLEFMSAERAANLLELVQAQGAIMQTDSIGFSTLLFGYLLAAYFIGANLTRVQVLILTVLYICSIGGVMFQLVANAYTAMGFMERFYEITDNTRELTTLNVHYLSYGLLIGTAIVMSSLYFMWTVRHPKTE